ncbi:hypothetical protein BDW69DRAFT_186662 [Aspergillus filifer]
MVKVVVAGGTGAVSQEIVAENLNSGKHDVTIWTRSTEPKYKFRNVTYTQANYDDQASMVSLLNGVHSVLCFISQPKVQHALIDACIEAGVNKSNSDAFAYHEKVQVHEYLQKVDKEKKVQSHLMDLSLILCHQTQSPTSPSPAMVLKHTLFQPGLFTKLPQRPQTIRKILPYLDSTICRCELPRDRFRQAQPKAFHDNNPGPFQIETVPTETLRSGKLNTSWTPLLPEFPTTDPSYDRVKFSEYIVAEIILRGLKGAWETSDEWRFVVAGFEVGDCRGVFGGVLGWKGVEAYA